MINVNKIKNMRGRITGYYGTIGAFQGPSKSTAAEARAAAEQALIAATLRFQTGNKIIKLHGCHAVVTPTLYGWEYTIIYPDHAGTAISSSWESVEYCVSSAKYHIAQNAWSIDCQDDFEHAAAMGRSSKLAEERYVDLLDWIAWQRDHARLKAEGLDDTDAHRQAQYNHALLRGVKPGDQLSA